MPSLSAQLNATNTPTVISPEMTMCAPTHRNIAVASMPTTWIMLSYVRTTKLPRNILFATRRNSLSIVSRNVCSAAAAFTASMPLIASI